MSFVTFGEIMLRMTPAEHGTKLPDSNTFSIGFAGSESNVASSLAILGNQVKFVTKLPQNAIGEAAIRSISSFGIDTTSIIRGGFRLGTYFIETGGSIRPSLVVYDRQGSAISQIKKGEFNWEDILRGKSWLFISGITPALSVECAEEAVLMVSLAKSLGLKVCFDFNFRRSLWKDRKAARDVFSRILEHTDLLCANAGSLADVYQKEFEGATELDSAREAIDMARTKFGVQILAFTVRNHLSASQNHLSAILNVQGEEYTSSRYTVDILDRFGTGDAFAAGLLHSFGKNWEYKKAIQFATAAFALKHTIKGDQHTSIEEEIISIMEGNTSGHVIR